MHIITGLNNGGAEGVLYRICAYDTSCQYIVVSLMDEGKYGSLLEEKGVKVHYLKMPRGRVSLSGLWRLFRLLREEKPDIVQTWMYHADLVGGIVARLVGNKSIFWNVRHSEILRGQSKRSTIWTLKICSFLSSYVPRNIIYCADQAQIVHEEYGYNNNKGVVIKNGYDLSCFTIDPNLRKQFRLELGVSEDETLIGMVGRYNAYKNHLNLIKALQLVKEAGYRFKLILVGAGLDYENDTLLQAISDSMLNDNVFLLGQRTDIQSIMNGLDLHVLSSVSEGFPNVLAEAMACGTPCVSTEVGDASLIVGQTGWIVPPRDATALANSIMLALDEKKSDPQAWHERKRLCRKQIVESFNIVNMIENYHSVWEN